MNILDPKADSRTAGGGASQGDDVWLPSSCSLCYSNCSIMAHRVDGVITKIEGNPDSVAGLGRLCGKGVSGIMTHYDPYRLSVPLRRTNPEKGIGIDPSWKEISWEEALSETAEWLMKIRADDPRKLVVQRTTTVIADHTPAYAFSSGFGTQNGGSGGGGLHCGNGAHLVGGLMHASWSIVPDFQYCNYALYFGASKGHAAGHASNANMKMAADARARGMRMVVVDPFANQVGAKATEWVPIRVGTDAGLALAMANVMVNDLGIYDAPYLKAKTNLAYLIGPDGRYVRDGASAKPAVWDQSVGKARAFDTAETDNMALEGEFEVGGVRCQPAFVLLREHLKTYTPEKGEEISTVPAANIRRLAKEFATEARVGSVIVIDGVEVPYRPAAAIAFRGSQGHRNSTYNMLAIDMLNHLVGSADMAGGCLGFNPASHGYPGTGRLRYAPSPDEDGMMMVGGWMSPHKPYPFRIPQHPERMGLQDLFPMGMGSVFQTSSDNEETWSKFDHPYRPEMIINIGANMLMSIGNKDTVAEAVKNYKFIVSCDIYLTESSDFADIVLPDADYLESLDSRSNFPFIFSHPAGMGEWCWPIRQPIVKPQGKRMPHAELLTELADRCGFLGDFNMAVNAYLDLEPPYRLDRDKRYAYEEVCDNDLKDKFGPEHGLDWFKENGVIKWAKKPEEVYWRHFVDVRVPIYWEFMPPMWEAINAIAEPVGFDVAREHYAALPDWLPCAAHECDKEGFDFYAFYYRDIIHTNSLTMENAWLDEAAEMDPFSYNVALNEDRGKALGLKNGDRVWVENHYGHKVDGKLRLTQAIHPEGVGIGACAGHWGKGMPRAKGKGVFFNDLVEIDWDHSCPSNLNLDLCAKVRVFKV